MAQLSQNIQPTMSSRDIARTLEVRHDKAKQTMDRLANRGVITFTPVGEKSTGGRPATVYMVGERDSYVVAAQMSPEFTGRLVDRWQALESGQAQPAKSGQPKLAGELALLECFCSISNPAPSSRIVLLEKIGSAHGLNTEWLPGYAEDAPSDASSFGSLDTASLTALIAEYGVPITAREMNKRLSDLGVIERRTRKARAGTKPYWCVTVKGLAYGKNITPAHSPRETQPHWYRERFISLLALVGMGNARCEVEAAHE